MNSLQAFEQVLDDRESLLSTDNMHLLRSHLHDINLSTNPNLHQKSHNSSLPVEILHQILYTSDIATLTTLSTVNRTFQAVSEQVLYRNIKILPTQKTIRCLQTLAARPSLAGLIRSYEIDDITKEGDALPAFYKLLSRALHNMTRLTDLTILIEGRHSDILFGCPFNLRTLTSSLSWDTNFTKWMLEQPDITNAIFCGRYVVGCALEPTAITKLTRISASPLILAAVVPGRPLEEVEVCLVHPGLFNQNLLSTTMKILSFSTGPLHSLRVITNLGNSSQNILGALRTVSTTLSTLDSFFLHAVSGSITS
ncbi:hypothetical protein SERLA73DRAFT_160207, partial [Serpula lacrymans var. lacrymans S7.3]